MFKKLHLRETMPAREKSEKDRRFLIPTRQARVESKRNRAELDRVGRRQYLIASRHNVSYTSRYLSPLSD